MQNLYTTTVLHTSYILFQYFSFITFTNTSTYRLKNYFSICGSNVMKLLLAAYLVMLQEGQVRRRRGERLSESGEGGGWLTGRKGLPVRCGERVGRSRCRHAAAESFQ